MTYWNSFFCRRMSYWNFDGISKTLTLKFVLYDHIAIKKQVIFYFAPPKLQYVGATFIAQYLI